MAYHGQGPPIPMPATADCKFATLFSDVSKDPFQGQYTSLYNPYFTVDPNNIANASTPASVRDTIAASGAQRMPLALGLLVNNILRVYLCPQRFDPALSVTLPPTISGKMFIFDGELYRNSSVSVDMRNTVFNLCASNVLVPSIAMIRAALVTDPTVDLLGPYTAANADTDTICTRYIVPIPFCYVPLFLRNDVTPNHFFMTTNPQMETDQTVADCSPFIDFFRSAFTCTGAGQGCTQNTSIANLPSAPP